MTSSDTFRQSPLRARRAPLAVAALLASLATVAFGWAAARATGQVTAVEQQTALLEAAERYFPGSDSGLSSRRIFRLTREQLDATVAAVLPGYAARSVKTAVSRDPLQTNYEYAELLALNPANLGALQGWIGEIAAAVRARPQGLIDCPAAKPGDDCLRGKARAFVLRAFRGDVTDERIERITEFYLRGVREAGLPQATGDLVEVVLNSPDFLFRKEIDTDRRRRLAPAQLLQSLSYTLADAPPDALGISSLEIGRILQRPEDAEKAVETILAAKATREKLVRFFKAWLEVKEPGEFTISPQVFPEFDDKLSVAMLAETDRFLRAVLAEPAPSLKAITQSTTSFPGKALAPIYAADIAGDAKPTTLDAAQRLGIFTQPAVLASHSGPTGSRPIKRGVFWVRKLMCMELDPPPPGTSTELYEQKGVTERQRIEAVTGQKACAGCHKMIDPFGFALESYDALGRWRTTENGAPIDPRISVDFLDEGPTRAATSVEALRAMTSSVMFKQCFVRQLFRFYMGRSEEAGDDPLLRRMFLLVARNDDIMELVRELATSDLIGRRR